MRARSFIAALLTLAVAPFATPSVSVAGPADPGRIVATSFAGDQSAVVSMDPDGSDLATVLEIPQDWAVGGLDVTEDGSLIAMTLAPGQRGRIYLADPNGSDFGRLTSGGGDWDSDPSFSPSGDRLVFTRYERGRSNLYRILTDGTGLRRLTSPSEPEADFATWSPNGQGIVFIDRGRRRERLIVADRQGQTFDVIYRAPADENLFTTAWSPDGSTIVFAAYDRNYLNAELWAIAPDGTGRTQLTDSPRAAEVSPAFSPDGSKIAVSHQSELTGEYRLLVMNADGMGRDVIEEAGSNIFHVGWGGTPTT